MDMSGGGGGVNTAYSGPDRVSATHRDDLSPDVVSSDVRDYMVEQQSDVSAQAS